MTDYLASTSALIKALKSPHDPPQAGWPSKIEIAEQAWRSDASELYRKSEILRDWILECWSQYRLVNGKLESTLTGKGKNKSHANPFLDHRYAELLLTILERHPLPVDKNVAIYSMVTAFLASMLESSAVSDRLLESYYSAFSLLLDGEPSSPALTSAELRSRSSKLDVTIGATAAEQWLEAFAVLVKNMPINGYRLTKLSALVCEELLKGLNVSSTRKRITQTLMQAVTADLLKAWTPPQDLQEMLLVVLQDLLFPVEILQSSTPIDLILQLPWSDDATRLLVFLPDILRSFVASITRQRYAVFPMTSAALAITRQKNIPPEIYVSGRVRDSIRVATQRLLEVVRETSEPWQARKEIWTVIQEWGGYSEADEGWPQLFAQALQEATDGLTSGSPDVLNLLQVLASVDPAGFSKGASRILPSTLLAGQTSTLMRVLEYYTLTQDVPAFVSLLTDAIQATSALAEPGSRYDAMATTLGSHTLTSAMRRSFRLSIATGISSERGWGLAVLKLGLALATALTDSSEAPAKKRKTLSGAASSSQGAVTFGILSRLFCILVGAAVDDNGDLGLAGRQKNLEAVLAKLPDMSNREDLVISAALARIERSLGRAHRSFSLSSVDAKGSEHAFELAQNATIIGDDVKWATGDAEWSGLASQTDDKNLRSALAQLWLERGMLFVHDCADDSQIDDVIRLVISNPTLPSSDSYQGAFALWTRSAEFWELPRFQSAATKLVLTATDREAAFRFAMVAPRDYLPKRVRNELVKEAYRTSGSIPRAYVVQVAETTSYLGPLLTDAKILEALMRDPSADISNLSIARIAFRTTLDALPANSAKSNLKLALKTATGPAAAALLDALTSSQLDVKSLGTDYVKLADESARKCSKKLPDSAGAWSVDDIQLASCLARYGKWRYAESPDALSLYREMIGFPDWRKILAAATSGNEAVAVLELIGHVLTPRQDPNDAQIWLASYVLLVDNEHTSSVLDDAFATVMSKVDVEPFAAMLAATVDSLKSNASAGLLRAAQQLFKLNVEGGGKIVTQQLPFLLRAVKSIVADANSSAILKTGLDVLLTVVNEKTTSLTANDVTILLTACHAAMQPCQSTGRQSDRQVFDVILSIVNDLVRHRRDLVVEQLQLLVATLSRTFSLFLADRRAQRDMIASTRPRWMQDPLGIDAARELARVFVTLTSRTVIRSQGKDTRSIGTMVGELSKHAPVLLIAYVRAVSHPRGMMPVDVRNALEPGLLALCEAVNAGGKAQYGMKGGEGVGDAFGLGEGEPDTKERETSVWGELWRKWQSKRYTGQG